MNNLQFKNGNTLASFESTVQGTMNHCKFLNLEKNKKEVSIGKKITQ